MRSHPPFGTLFVLLVCAPLLLRAQTPPAAMTTPLPAAQRLEAGDLIQITVFEAPELATEGRLDSAGAITLPAAGSLVLAGQTAAQAEQTIAARLQLAYLRSPQVHVLVREFAPQPVAVLGAVKDPGVYSARSFPNLESALGAAGGMTSLAGRRVLITRHDGQVQTLGVDALAHGSLPASVPVHGGDVIRVEPAATVYVGGDVRKPGAYPVPVNGLSLIEALTLAGGLAPNNQASHTRLTHAAADASASTERVDAERILAGKEADIRLQPNDLVYVPPSGPHALAVATLQTAVGLATTIVSGVIIFH